MIIPALLTHDLEQAKSKLHAVHDLSEWVQLDIMDGKFVPNKTLTIEQYKNLEIPQKIELHLMVESPHEQLQAAQDLGAQRVFFHVEAVENIELMITELQKYSFQYGIVINPETDISALEPFMEYVGFIMIMGVHPGRSGQEFIPSMLDKIKDIHEKYSEKELEIDGGVNLENIQDIKAAGVTLFGVTSGLFNADNIIERYKTLSSLIK